MKNKLQKVLCVDDEEDIRVIFAYLFEQMGCEVAVCSSGFDGLEQAIHFQPDLILLDVMMPKMDGVETLKKLKSVNETEKFPVIFVTAKTIPEELQRLRALPVLDVITKPVDLETFPEHIINLWSNSQISPGESHA